MIQKKKGVGPKRSNRSKRPQKKRKKERFAKSFGKLDFPRLG